MIRKFDLVLLYPLAKTLCSHIPIMICVFLSLLREKLEKRTKDNSPFHGEQGSPAPQGALEEPWWGLAVPAGCYHPLAGLQVLTEPRAEVPVSFINA